MFCSSIIPLVSFLHCMVSFPLLNSARTLRGQWSLICVLDHQHQHPLLKCLVDSTKHLKPSRQNTLTTICEAGVAREWRGAGRPNGSCGNCLGKHCCESELGLWKCRWKSCKIMRSLKWQNLWNGVGRESEVLLLVTENKDFRDSRVRPWAVQLTSCLTLGKCFYLLSHRAADFSSEIMLPS